MAGNVTRIGDAFHIIGCIDSNIVDVLHEGLSAYPPEIVDLLITSNGGPVALTFVIIDLLRCLKISGKVKKIRTFAIGDVKNCAFLLWLIGDERYASTLTTFYIHNVVSANDQIDPERTKIENRKFSKFISGYTGVSPFRIRKMMKRGTTFGVSFFAAEKISYLDMI